MPAMTSMDKEVLTAEDVQALQPLYAAVIAALKEVYDPEIPVNIYDLGLIFGCEYFFIHGRHGRL